MCLVCKEEAEMKELSISNDIKINEYYDSSDDIEYCTHCGALFLKRYDLGKNQE